VLPPFLRFVSWDPLPSDLFSNGTPALAVATITGTPNCKSLLKYGLRQGNYRAGVTETTDTPNLSRQVCRVDTLPPRASWPAARTPSSTVQLQLRSFKMGRHLMPLRPQARFKVRELFEKLLTLPFSGTRDAALTPWCVRNHLADAQSAKPFAARLNGTAFGCQSNFVRFHSLNELFMVFR
jgi:hypothetical protein